MAPHAPGPFSCPTKNVPVAQWSASQSHTRAAPHVPSNGTLTRMPVYRVRCTQEVSCTPHAGGCAAAVGGVDGSAFAPSTPASHFTRLPPHLTGPQISLSAFAGISDLTLGSHALSRGSPLTDCTFPHALSRGFGPYDQCLITDVMTEADDAGTAVAFSVTGPLTSALSAQVPITSHTLPRGLTWVPLPPVNCPPLDSNIEHPVTPKHFRLNLGVPPADFTFPLTNPSGGIEAPVLVPSLDAPRTKQSTRHIIVSSRGESSP